MFPKEKKMQIKLDKLVVKKFPVVTNFNDVIKSCRDCKSSRLPVSGILFTLSVPN